MPAEPPRAHIVIEWATERFQFIDRKGSKGQRGLMRVGHGAERQIVLPIVRSLDLDDAILPPGMYRLAMTHMATSKRQALLIEARYTLTKGSWEPNLKPPDLSRSGKPLATRGLFIHDVGAHARPHHLNGCISPGLFFEGDGCAWSDRAMEKVWAALNGFIPDGRVNLDVLP